MKQHLSYVCKIRKYGTLFYRSNGDLLHIMLMYALHQPSQYSVDITDIADGVKVIVFWQILIGYRQQKPVYLD